MKSVGENEAKKFLLCADFVTPGNVKVCESGTVLVNGIYKYARYEQNWLRSLRVIFFFFFFFFLRSPAISLGFTTFG